MVSMSKPQSVSQAQGYLTKENYYQKNSEKGFFYGKGLEFLGLENGLEVTPEMYEKLLNGYHPVSGEALVINAGEADRRAGMDVTFSAPKSVSVLMEFHEGNHQNSKAELIRNAHDLAVKNAMKKLENEYAKTRIYDVFGDRKKVDAKIVYATFQHDISREVLGQIDPQLHSHNFIFSTVFYHDKEKNIVRNLALSNEEIYKNKMYLGQIYRSELAQNLKNLGYEIEVTDRKNGFFEIAGFEKNQLDEFSNRSKLIREVLPKYREKYPNMDENELLQVIVKDTKKAKKEIDRDAVREQNLERMRGVNLDFEQANSLDNHEKEVVILEPLIENHIDKSLENLTEKQSIFTREDLYKELLKYGLEYGYSEKIYSDFVAKREDIFQLDKNVFSTKKMIEAEKNIIYSIHDSRGKGKVFEEYQGEKINEFLAENYANMTEGQDKMVRFILGNEDQFIAVQGDAGTGKTYAVKAVNEYLKKYHKEQEIIGISYTGKAAEGLEKESGIKSETVHSFLQKEESREGKNRVIIVDEAGMIGSIQMNEIIENAKKKGDKVVFIGDTKQFKSINAGRAFADMQKYGIKTVHMDEVLRQQTEYTKESVSLLKSQEVEKSINVLQKNGRITEKDLSSAREEISRVFSNLSKKKRMETLIIASTNSDRKAINDMIRERLGKSGKSFSVFESVNKQGIERHYTQGYKIGEYIAIEGKIDGFKKGEQLKITGIVDEKRLIVSGKDKRTKEKVLDVYQHGNSLQVYRQTEKTFQKGDVIVFNKNKKISKDKNIRVRNGERAVIKSIKKNGDVTLESGKKFNIYKMNHVDHGYAITDYKAQGATTKHVMVMARSDMANFNSFYTQITRAKREISLWTDNLEQLKANIENVTQEKSTLDYTIRIKEKGEKTHERTDDTGRTQRDQKSTERDPKRADAAEKRVTRNEQNGHRLLRASRTVLTRIGRRVKGRGRTINRVLKERILRPVKANPNYIKAVERLQQIRRVSHGRKTTLRETITGKTTHHRRSETRRRLARIGTLQSNLESTQGRTLRKGKHRLHGLSGEHLVRDKFHPKMLLQTDVPDRMAGGRRSDQSMRRQGDSRSHDERRGVDIKASFKEFMKQHKGKEVEMIDKSAQRSSPKPVKEHSKETVKEFFKNRQREKERDRGR